MKWTDEHYKVVDALISQKITYAEIGRQLGRSAASIANYCKRAGIKSIKLKHHEIDRNELYDIALNEFKASIASNGNIDTGFIHTDRFFLLDRDRVVRGWYNGLDSVNLDKLIKDVVLLNMERDKKKKRNLFRK